MIRMPHLNWPQRLAVVGGVLVFGLVGGMELPTAGATNIDVSVSSACVGTSWQVTLNAHNTHDAPLRIVNDNSVENWTATLAPGEAQSARINPPDATFHYVWSSPDGHLVGTTTATLTRPTGCTPATSTPTTEVTTSSTTAPTAVTTSSIQPTSPPTSVSAAPVVPSTNPRPPGSSSSSSVTQPRTNLPATGIDWPVVVAADLVLALVGACLVLCARRRGV